MRDYFFRKEIRVDCNESNDKMQKIKGIEKNHELKTMSAKNSPSLLVFMGRKGVCALYYVCISLKI